MKAVCLVIGSGLTQFYESCMSGYWQWINSVLWKLYVWLLAVD